MSKLLLISTLLLFLALEWSSSQSDCPYRCQCFSPVQVLCADERMSSLPRNMSHQVREFILMTSSVSYLFSNTLEDSPQLSKLIFLNNAIRSIHAHSFNHLTHLEVLEISGNPWLENLYLGTFSKQHNLTKLMLNYNRFKTVLSGMFGSLRKLDTLQMKEGLMDTFSMNYMLRLHGNPWKCDCGLWYLHDWILRNEQSVDMLDRTLCEKNSVDVRNCLLQVSGDAVIIKCKVETCLPLTVKVQLQDEQGNVKEHVVRNEWAQSDHKQLFTLLVTYGTLHGYYAVGVDLDFFFFFFADTNICLAVVVNN
uniref:LRRCT domain-containing protein n=1 Tax=Periophthalmus magnuspinnatus TaxID=409849 RepID=A0A3B4AJ55_9GOBI